MPKQDVEVEGGYCGVASVVSVTEQVIQFQVTT